MMDQSENIQIAIEAAKKAADIILNGYSVKNTVDIKANQSQVTEIDKASEQTIIQYLETNSPHKIMAEETRNETLSENSYWVVDPLDGTTNFIRRIPLCAVSIALIEEFQPIVGVVFNPITNELFYAEKGKGAFLNDSPINCSDESSILFANSGYDLEHKEAFADVISKTTQFSVRKFGTTAYELATIAKGGGDAFCAWGDELWDHAAGIVLVREAGGLVTDWKGNNWKTTTNYVLAGNQKMHCEILKIFRQTI